MKISFFLKNISFAMFLILISLYAPSYGNPKCNFQSVSSINFGSYDPFSMQPDDSTGTIVVKCNGNTSKYIITLNKGTSPTYFPRTLKSDSQIIKYNLYTDASRSTVWGDGTDGTGFITGNGKGTMTAYVYGRIFEGQDPSVGSYNDMVEINIEF